MKNAKDSFLASILKDGEKYAGILLGKDGEPDLHIILLPGEAERVNFKGAVEFAAKIAGFLPSRRMQSLLFANLKEEFSSNWYWSSEQREGGSAWTQYFGDGDQDWFITNYNYRARAVRSIVI